MAEPNEYILALSWNIATEPKIYRDIFSNPYTSRALHIIKERFQEDSRRCQGNYPGGAGERI